MSLPESWLETTVRKVITDMQPGFAQSPGEDDIGMTPQIRTHNISPDGKITLSGMKHVSASDKELSKYGLSIDDVVFNNTNSEEWVGKTAIFNIDGNYVFSNHMTRLRADAELIKPEFLSAYLHFLWSIGYSKTRAKRWVSQAGIEGSSLAAFKIPLPTSPEQHYIIDVLQQIDRIGKLRENAKAITDRLVKQHFIELFGHPAENPNGFDLLPFDKFGTLDRGVSKNRPRDASHLFGGPYPFIQTGDVSNAGDWITEYKTTYSEAGLEQSKLWPKGTLCITIAANIAKAAILDFDACFPDSVVGFAPYKDIHSEYVLYCLRFYQELFEFRAPKSAQMNINLETLRRLRMPKPPEELQRKFTGFVKEIRLLDNKLTDQGDAHDELFNELKIAAFIGDLSENWREYNQEVITSADAARDVALSKLGKKLSKRKIETVETKRQPKAISETRRWLVRELSVFQMYVFDAFMTYSNQPLLVEDQERFIEFYEDDNLRNMLSDFEYSPNKIRRTLGQLASLGLIAKVTLPKTNNLTEGIEYLKAFRPLREDEDSKLMDIAALKRSFKPKENYYYEVTPDYATSSRAGAHGMFQVVALTDDRDRDRTSLVDQGRHYDSVQALKTDIAKALKVDADQIVLDTVGGDPE